MADQPVPVKPAETAVPQQYADGLSQIHVINDMVKLEFFTQIPTSPEKIEPFITGRLVLTLQGYLQMFEVMKDINSKLVANGTIEEQK